MNQIFDINRVVQFAKLKLNLNRKLFAIAVAGYLGIIFIITFFLTYHLDPGRELIVQYFHNTCFLIMMYGGAIFFGGRANREMNSGAKSIEQLMVPASIFEKFIVPMVFSSIGWMLFSTIIYQVFAVLVNALWGATFSLELGFYNIFNIIQEGGWAQAVKFYFLIHAIFFLGATAFKKYAIPKTALAAFIIQNGLNLLGLIVILILFGNVTDFGFAVDATFRRPEIKEWADNGGMENLISLTYWASAFFLPIIFYFTAYFKLKEREV